MSKFRWVIRRHTDHAVLSWQAFCPATGETQGYGLTEIDAARLVTQLNGS